MKPKIGDETWEVEWCSMCPKNKEGDYELDQASYSFRHCKAKGNAVNHARKVYPACLFGSVRITPMRFVPYDEDDAATMPHAGYWDAIGDVEYYEGEEEPPA